MKTIRKIQLKYTDVFRKQGTITVSGYLQLLERVVFEDWKCFLYVIVDTEEKKRTKIDVAFIGNDIDISEIYDTYEYLTTTMRGYDEAHVFVKK